MGLFDDILVHQKKLLKTAKHPGFINPMLATLTKDYFDNPDWIYERKLDGVRCLLSIKNKKVTLYSRNENNITESYSELSKAFEKHDYPDLIVDGEIVAFDGKVTSFSKLQGRNKFRDKEMESSKVKTYIYLFDIIYYDGFLLEELPLRTRKKILKTVIHWEPTIRYTPHRNGKGKEYYKEACEKGWEGIIAKVGDGKYHHGRSKEWLKFKCGHGQELVIAGFTEPQGSRMGFGAMLVGFYKNGKLYYAGKVGTGFDVAFLEKWRTEFDKMTQKESPFVDFKDDDKGKNHWIKPQYVGEFGFTEWTNSNKLRHPRFLGMRDDKKAQDVVKEE